MSVFLGGCCTTEWRRDVVIPMLEASNVTFYDPKVAEWKESLVEEENKAKAASEWIFFVITGKSRCLVSMIELAELMALGRNVVLVVEALPENPIIMGEALTKAATKDHARARFYLRDMATRYSVPCHATIMDGVQALLANTKNAEA